MSGHTKGPWRNGDHPFDVIADEYTVVATVAHDRQGLNRGRETSEANARLIAAAPDLLAALHLAAEALDAYSDVNDGPEGPTPNRALSALQEISDVIAKAEGRQE